MSRDYTHDVLKSMLAAEVLLSNPETIFHPFPRPTEPALCEGCHAVYVERGERCDECEREQFLIDLTVRRNIKCGVEQYAPADQRYWAIDDNAYDGVGSANIIGRGPTKREAIKDLLTKLAERS